MPNIRNAKQIYDLSQHLDQMGEDEHWTDGNILITVQIENGIREYSIFYLMPEDECDSDDSPLITSYFSVKIAMVAMNAQLQLLHPNKIQG